jgi:hypothetical protein
MTGFRLGDFLLVTSAFSDEPIDILWWGIFLIAFILFIAREKIGRWCLCVFLTIWGCIIQYPMYFSSHDGIESYNVFFRDTYHLFPPSDTILVKDFYHLTLDILIGLSLILAIVYIIKSLIQAKKEKQSMLNTVK